MCTSCRCFELPCFSQRDDISNLMSKVPLMSDRCAKKSPWQGTVTVFESIKRFLSVLIFVAEAECLVCQKDLNLGEMVGCA